MTFADTAASALAFANAAPFALTLTDIPAEAYTVHRWLFAAALDEPYELTLVLHVLREFKKLFDQATWEGLNSAAGLRACFLLQSQASSWEPLHGRIARIALGAGQLQSSLAAANAAGPDVIACPLRLRPRLWWAGLTQASRSFQRLSVQEAVMQVLGASLGLSAAHFEFRLPSPPLRRRYRQQYQEGDLAFVSRLLEREGWCYFFEQGDERERMVVTDDAAGCSRPPQWSGVRFVAESGQASFEQSIPSVERRFSAVTTEHQVDDYNYRTASTPLQTANPRARQPLGQQHSYGSHAETPDEAALRLRQQGERSAQHALRASTSSSLTALAPGQLIGIVDGPRRGWAAGSSSVCKPRATASRLTATASPPSQKPRPTAPSGTHRCPTWPASPTCASTPPTPPTPKPGSIRTAATSPGTISNIRPAKTAWVPRRSAWHATMPGQATASTSRSTPVSRP